MLHPEISCASFGEILTASWQNPTVVFQPGLLASGQLSVLRTDAPGRYEAYVDLVPGEWTKVKIEVNDGSARLFVHDNEQPTLIVNDLKLGAESQGAVALWIHATSEGYFSNLRITHWP